MNYNLKFTLPNSSIGQDIKKYTQSVYKEIYGASINPNPDEFIYLEQNNEIYASFGITYRENKKLFSECYLDAPLENEENKLGNYVTSEVGSFISIKNGFGLQLYKLLPYILYEKNSFYALVTLTRKVYTLFNRLNFRTSYLIGATEDRVPVRNIWGTFYETNPRTFILDVKNSCTDRSLLQHARKLDIEICELGQILNKKIFPKPYFQEPFATVHTPVPEALQSYSNKVHPKY